MAKKEEKVEATVVVKPVAPAKVYYYTGNTIHKNGYIFTKNSFISEEHYKKILKIEDFKEDLINFKDLDTLI